MASPKKAARISDGSVAGMTGRTWSERFKLLDEAGAAKMESGEAQKALWSARIEKLESLTAADA